MTKYKIFNVNSTLKDKFNPYIFENVTVLNCGDDINDGSSIIKNIKVGEFIWPVKFSELIPKNYIYLNREQRKLHKVGYSDEIEITESSSLSEIPEDITINIRCPKKKFATEKFLNNLTSQIYSNTLL